MYIDKKKVAQFHFETHKKAVVFEKKTNIIFSISKL